MAANAIKQLLTLTILKEVLALNDNVIVSNANDFYNFFVEECKFESEKAGMYIRYYVSPQYGEGFIEQIKFPNGLELCITDVYLKKSIGFEYNLINPPYEINYMIDGNLFHNEMEAKDMNISSGNISVYFRKKMSGLFKIIKDRRVRYITIIADERFIEESLLNEEYHKGLSKFKRSNRAIELTKPHKTRAELKAIFNQMVSCDFSNVGKLMYLQSKSIEALCYVWEKEITMLENQENTLFIDKDALESIELARQLIEDNMVEPFTIKELAKQVHMNEYKLKKGFKQLYNTTIFGYLRHIRMVKAKELLEQRDMNIGQVSCAVGYTNASHFSKNFKEYYGENPKIFRFGA
ncbi:helix-turn-helix transcriptional regulator [Vallitalea guaymasensis]|mgnify:FL=1|uniref:helix-turn-helix transcriptional regulator n=1 Tax=Vallitalea guaymasensis TaxID=1185412 RepID=UPI0023555417|nr:helix-turn-helix transcriptional regulator [Vallitalea guaymasensis]